MRRLIDAAPEFERIFTDPLKGTLVEIDTYRPTSAMRRRIAVRDGRCRFVGCMMPASRCDIDHTKAWEEDGPTSLANLGHLCGGHHTGKHHGDWEVRQLPDGVYEWRSPSGFVFRDAPVQFGRLTALPNPDRGEQSSATQPSTDSGGQVALPSTAPGLGDSRSSGRADDTAAAQRAVGGGDLEEVGGGGGDLEDAGDAAQVGDVSDVRDPIRARHEHCPGEHECEREDRDEDRHEDEDKARHEDEHDLRSRFPKLGFLEEFRRKRAAKKAAIESGSSRRDQPEFRPTGQRGDEGGGDQLRAESSRGKRSDSSDDPPPF
ncbi:hypothetical protein C5E07_18205 [Pseudoclavibacter sp. RFBJ3]|nr:hypothetical protein C5C12_18145 [Pseudoclavibacter sp. RFBJ5]PPF89165.1 hypothetical protein C5E07_18205 [Pseudoclavibacter sp. RFBJ3]PPF95790.1 hypothetical protein C5C19_17405 [Pseudoclavibacter sp. RFBH5]PPG25941.1 hypothetical protein C5E13_01050 [Pseudoclavibacter sp. RFBI4]